MNKMLAYGIGNQDSQDKHHFTDKHRLEECRQDALLGEQGSENESEDRRRKD